MYEQTALCLNESIFERIRRTDFDFWLRLLMIPFPSERLRFPCLNPIAKYIDKIKRYQHVIVVDEEKGRRVKTEKEISSYRFTCRDGSKSNICCDTILMLHWGQSYLNCSNII